MAVFACTALAVDVGFWRYQQRLAQTAADSAALAGAMEMRYNASPSPIQTAGVNDAATNGFASAYVKVNTPPQNPNSNYYNDPSSVEVVIDKPQPSFFAKFVGMNAVVGARAVARYEGGGGCIYTLSPQGNLPPGAPYGFQTTGGTFSVGSCTIYDNGNFNASGGTTTASGFDVAGTINHTSGVSPAPVAGPSQGDPCWMLTPCRYFSANPPSFSTCANNTGTPSGSSVSPGVYCKGLQISGGSVTMNSGVYIMTGGEFKVSGGTVTAAAGGVSIYIGAGSDVDLTGGTISLSALTSASASRTYATAAGTGTLPPGLLFYQPSSNTAQDNLTGGGGAGTCPSANPVMSGIFYAPSAFFNITGGGEWDPSIIIAGAIQTTGGNFEPCMTNAGPGTQLTPGAVLVE